MNFKIQTKVDMLRHGACQGGEIFRGSTDVELSDQGWSQMRHSIEDMSYDAIVTSPLKRCRFFAEQLAEQLQIELTVDNAWREFDFGIWEGRNRDEVWKENKDDLMKFFTDPRSFTPPKGDSYQSVCDRILPAWRRILEQQSERRVLLITHGGIIRTLYAELISLPSHAFNTLDVPYACLSRWKHFGRDTSIASQLVFHNLRAETQLL